MLKHGNSFFPDDVVYIAPGGIKTAASGKGRVKTADPDTGKVKVAWDDGTETWWDANDLVKEA